MKQYYRCDADKKGSSLRCHLEWVILLLMVSLIVLLPNRDVYALSWVEGHARDNYYSDVGATSAEGYAEGWDVISMASADLFRGELKTFIWADYSQNIIGYSDPGISPPPDESYWDYAAASATLGDYFVVSGISTPVEITAILSYSGLVDYIGEGSFFGELSLMDS